MSNELRDSLVNNFVFPAWVKFSNPGSKINIESLARIAIEAAWDEALENQNKEIEHLKGLVKQKQGNAEGFCKELAAYINENTRLRGAMKKSMDATGTGTLHYKILEKALKEGESLGESLINASKDAIRHGRGETELRTTEMETK